MRRKIIIGFMLLGLTACGTTKKFYKQCEEINNGYLCEE